MRLGSSQLGAHQAFISATADRHLQLRKYLLKEAIIAILCLIGCCKTKRRQAAPARDLYCSPLFQLCRAWAEQHADAWAILSAHHGVVRPDRMIKPYDTTIAQRRPFGGPRLTVQEFAGWLYGQVQAWRSCHVVLPEVPRLVVLAGKAYWTPLVEHGLEVDVPLDGMGIGQRLRWLRQQTAASTSGRAQPTLQRLLFLNHTR